MWAVERMRQGGQEEYERWFNELWSPPTGTDPDTVTQDVVDEEMSLFYELKRQTGG